MLSSWFGLAAVVVLLTAAGKAPDMANPDTEARALMMDQMAGVWTGTFRRYDADGQMTAELPSKIIVRFPEGEADYDYHQTNILTLPDGREQRIDSYGSWEGARLSFSNARLEGQYALLHHDARRRSSVLLMQFTDGSGITLSEIITVSQDMKTRHRAAQFFKEGTLLRRTLVDEVRQ